MDSNSTIINRVLEGDRQAFARLITRYEYAAKTVAMNILGDYHLAEDAVQEAFVKAFEKLHTLKKHQAFGPWLLKITGNCARVLAKQYSRTDLIEDHSQVYDQSSSGLFSPENRQLLEEINLLPMQERLVIIHFYFNNYSTAQIAHMLQKPVGTITKQLSRARRNLHISLKEDYYGK